MTGEHEAALRRAFVDGRCDYIVIDSIHQRFQMDGVRAGLKCGWLTGEEKQIDEQDTQLRYRLTDTGRAHFGLQREAQR